MRDCLDDVHLLLDQRDGPSTKSKTEFEQYRWVYQPRELSVLIGDLSKRGLSDSYLASESL